MNCRATILHINSGIILICYTQIFKIEENGVCLQKLGFSNHRVPYKLIYLFRILTFIGESKFL